MSDSKNSSQAQQKTDESATANPFVKMSEELISTLTQLGVKAAAWEQKGAERSREAAAQSAQMAELALEYWTALAASSRQITIDMAKQVHATVQSMRAA